MNYVDYTKLKARLKAAGRSQRELAKHLGIGSGEVSKYLSGKHSMGAERYLRIEAFLAEAERGAPVRGVAKTRAPISHGPAPIRSLTLEEAKALANKPPQRLPAKEKAQIVRELVELGDAYRSLMKTPAPSEDELLGYGPDGLPTQ